MNFEFPFPDWCPEPGTLVKFTRLATLNLFDEEPTDIADEPGEVVQVTVSKHHVGLEVRTAIYEDGKRVHVHCACNEVEAIEF